MISIFPVSKKFTFTELTFSQPGNFLKKLFIYRFGSIHRGLKRKIKGIVHDESASGKTVFIEPAERAEYPYKCLLDGILCIVVRNDQPAYVPVDRFLVRIHQQPEAFVGMLPHCKNDIFVVCSHYATGIIHFVIS